MKIKLASVVVAGCMAAVAASASNYDLLGRRDSRMNSPMVYKDVDYSNSLKKGQQKVGSALENRALMKTRVGMQNGACGLEGRYNSQGWGLYNYYYSTKKYCANDPYLREWTRLTASDGYINPSNDAFIEIRMNETPSSVYESGLKTNTKENEYRVSWQSMSFRNPVETSPYEANQWIRYSNLATIRDAVGYSNKNSFDNWYVNYSINEMSDVGVYLVAYGLPAKMKEDDDVKYIRDPSSGEFKRMPGPEMDATNMYKVLKNTSKRSVIYVTSTKPENPASADGGRSQIYMGVRSSKNAMGDESASLVYSTQGKNLDNYIYDNRTIEIVPAGNSAKGKNFFNAAHAANAITVGAIDPLTGSAVGYNPTTNPKYCSLKNKPCDKGRGSRIGSQKPEIYNYSHFYTNDKKKVYEVISSKRTYSHAPYYDGTDAAAAYTAGMVSDLLATNAFYRWHPEVVRALLLTSSVASGKKVPTYETLIPKRGSKSIVHDSRYWVGDINKMKTYTNGVAKEIRFAVKVSDYENYRDKKYVAAISWLSRGDDIDKLGKIPQNFDLIAYPSDSDDVNYAQSNPKYSVGEDNNFEILSPFSASKDYMIFIIQLRSDDSSDEYKGQIALGFDLIAY